MAEPWFMYVLRCNADSSLYCGVTTDVERRVAEHNGKGSRGSKYVRSRGGGEVVGAWAFPNQSEAQAAETKFKRLGKAQKEGRLMARGRGHAE